MLCTALPHTNLVGIQPKISFGSKINLPAIFLFGAIMSYKTILVHVDQSPHAAARIEIAAKIAIAENAHLIGAAMSGISQFLYQENSLGITGPVIDNQINAFYESCNIALAEFERIAKEIGVLSFEKRLLDDDAEGGLVLQARYSDLVVVSQTDSEDSFSRLITDLPEYVVLNSVRPVLIVPYAGRFEPLARRILVAWDGSMEATRAITNALPLLKKSQCVTLAVFNPSARLNVHGEQPGADIALFLTRHGVKVDVLAQQTYIDIGNTLLSLSSDLGSELIVMGGYGHARFREMLLGGATNTVLKTMTVPVLMSH